MQMPADREALLVKKTNRFARTFEIQPVTAATRKERQYRAFKQALGIDHCIIGMLTQTCYKAGDFAPRSGVPETAPPAPKRNRDHRTNARMELRYRTQRFLDQPVDLE